MAVEFKESRTRENLMRAFAGESQARNRYTIAAETAREQGLFAISQIFLFTADQERAHAARFYDLLKNLNGTTIAIDGSYPVDQFDNVPAWKSFCGRPSTMRWKKRGMCTRPLARLPGRKDSWKFPPPLSRSPGSRRCMGNGLESWQSFWRKINTLKAAGKRRGCA